MNKAQLDAALALIDTARPDIAAVLHSIPIKAGPLEPGSWAEYRDQSEGIRVSQTYVGDIETEDLAATLIHEGMHALDDRNGTLGSNDDIDAIIPAEQRAKRAEVDFIVARNPNGKPEIDEFDRDMNAWIAEPDLDERVAEVYFDRYMADMLSSVGVNF